MSKLQPMGCIWPTGLLWNFSHIIIILIYINILKHYRNVGNSFQMIFVAVNIYSIILSSAVPEMWYINELYYNKKNIWA
jgi:hypothetical protein